MSADGIPEGGEPRDLGEDPPWGRRVLAYLSDNRDRRLRVFERADTTVVALAEVYGAYVCWWAEENGHDADWVPADAVPAAVRARPGEVAVLPGEWRTEWSPGPFSCLAFAEEDAREECPWIDGLVPVRP